MSALKGVSNDTDQYTLAAGHHQGASPVERVDDDDGRAWRRLRRRVLGDVGRERPGNAAEGGPVMSGCVDYPVRSSGPKTRIYEVIARAGGWSISLNGACTQPFRSRRAAERIAKTLQRQADALTDKPKRTAHHHA